MSHEIITLPKHLANQIAAGEVVERPLSVVKELLENALDAGATRIDISLKNGGIDLIELRDNGAWIPQKSLKKAVEKYSTSKIASLEDLTRVLTFWFRGEALASIASVSRFTLISSDGSGPEAYQISTEDGEHFLESLVSWDQGTTVRVENLFHSTPARLNYLKTPRTEYVKILDFVQKMSLILPEVHLTLSHDGKELFSAPLGQSSRARIKNVFGSEFSEHILELKHNFNGVEIRGMISDPKISFPTKKRQVMFVNHRLIHSPMIAKAIGDAYNRFIAPKMSPAYVLEIYIDPTQVDVNVHPRKMEVRFANEASLFRSVFHGVKNELEKVSLISSQTDIHPQSCSSLGEKETTMKAPLSSKGEGLGVRYHTGSGTKFKHYSPYTNTTPNPWQAALKFSEKILGSGEEIALHQDLHETPLGRIIGQLHNSYIILETREGLKILDQHALAERVLYEKLSSQSYTPTSQKILWGIWLHLSSSEQEVLSQCETNFSDLWIEIDTLSDGNIILQAIPDFMKRENIEKIFRNILEDISAVGSQSIDEIRHKIWAYTACRSAVKFWDPLSLFEMHALLRDASLEYSATCPHGRPVVWEIGLWDLQKKYER